MKKTMESSDSLAYSLDAAGFDAGWLFPTAGFDAVRVLDKTGAGTVWMLARPGPWLKYRISARRRLLRDFDEAAADPTEDRFIRLADRYGPLRRPTPLGAQPVYSASDLLWGERLVDWADALKKYRLLREAALAIAVVRQPDGATLSKVESSTAILRTLVGHSNGRARYAAALDAWGRGEYWGPDPWVSWAAMDLSKALEAVSRREALDLADVANYVVQEAVNEELRGHVGVVLHPFVGGALRMWADSLLAFVYLTFASSLGPAASAQPARHRICLQDSRPFIPGRRDQRYCDKRCRERAAYRRKTTARTTEVERMSQSSLAESRESAGPGPSGGDRR